MSLGIIAALPREVGALVRGWHKRQVAPHVVLYTRGQAVVACAGMGAARAALAVEALAALPVTEIISVGLAGACDMGLRAGEIVRAGMVIDGRTGERFVDDRFKQVLVSTEAIANLREKQLLRAVLGADAVDMEAATVARIARSKGLGFRTIKAISDAADFEIEGLSRFSTGDGQFREAAFAVHAALRPAMWSKVISLGRNSSKALAALTNALRDELESS